MERKKVKTNQNNNDNNYNTVNDITNKKGGNSCFIAYQMKLFRFTKANNL